jgi:hypothetical protein
VSEKGRQGKMLAYESIFDGSNDWQPAVVDETKSDLVTGRVGGKARRERSEG